MNLPSNFLDHHNGLKRMAGRLQKRSFKGSGSCSRRNQGDLSFRLN